MPRRESRLPKHRATTDPRSRRAGAVAAMGFVALCATGVTVTSGIVARSEGAGAAASVPSGPGTSGPDLASQVEASTLRAHVESAALVGRRSLAVSRSDSRTASATSDPVKKAVVDQQHGGQVTATEDLTRRDPRTVARALLGDFGFDSGQFSCLDSLYVSESGWNVHADNPGSSAYGIPQALPGSKMASAGADWQDDAATQIRWGLGYIKARYGTPCSAWSFKQGHNWY